MVRKRNEFLCGMAAILATLIKTHDQPSIAKDMIVGHGLTLVDFEKACTPESDMQELRKCDDRALDYDGEDYENRAI